MDPQANPDLPFEWYEDREVAYTVGASRSPGSLVLDVYEGAQTGTAAYFSGTKEADSTWATWTNFGVRTGELDDPYVFYILPEQVQITPMTTVTSPYLLSMIGGALSNQWTGNNTYPLYPDPSVTQGSISIGDGYKLVYYKAPNRTLKGTELSGYTWELITVRNIYRLGSGIAAGEYPVYIGMGSLSDLGNLQTVAPEGV